MFRKNLPALPLLASVLKFRRPFNGPLEWNARKRLQIPPNNTKTYSERHRNNTTPTRNDMPAFPEVNEIGSLPIEQRGAWELLVLVPIHRQ